MTPPGCTLGVQSILSAKPAKRFATIVAMNACVVQKLTRKDQGQLEMKLNETT